MASPCRLSRGNAYVSSAATGRASRRCCGSSTANRPRTRGRSGGSRACDRAARPGRHAVGQPAGLRCGGGGPGRSGRPGHRLPPRGGRGGEQADRRIAGAAGPPAARARGAGRLAARAARRARPRAARASRRRHRRHPVRRLAPARPAGPRARRAARRCCCSTSRPTTWTSTPSRGSRRSSPTTPGAVVFVTHDRAFLQRLATRIVELDRGRLTSWPGDYADVPAAEGGVARRRGRAAGRSSTRSWRRKKCGCARASRPGGRATRAACARCWRCARSGRPGASSSGSVRMQVEQADASGTAGLRGRAVSARRSTGRRSCATSRRASCAATAIGLIGPNGVGQDDAAPAAARRDSRPDAGEVRRGANVQVAYYDQQREQLDPERTVFDTIGDGNDTVTVNGQPRHVHGVPARLPVSRRSGRGRR